VKTLRHHLSRLAADYGELRRAAPGLFRTSVDGARVAPDTLKFGGERLTDATRGELLAKLNAGEHVELEVDLLAYEQESGVSNRKFVRFRDGLMVKLGRSGTGTVFLRDHEQGNSLAVAGEVIASATEKVADGKYVIRQTVRLTASWAVRIALEGNLRAVSIGWNPTGPIECSIHNAPVWSKPECYCWPGQTFEEQPGEGGKGKRLARKAGGPIVAEFIYTDAELVETSMVPIGGVRTAHAEDVRAALFASLSAGNPSIASALERELDNHGTEPEELLAMNEEELKKLRAALGLPETATVAEVLAAANTNRAVEQIQRTDLEAATDRIAKLEAAQRKSAEDGFIHDALSSGRIAKGDEDTWRALYGANPARATELMAKRPESSATPVGAPAQREQAPAELDHATEDRHGGEVLRIEGGGIPGVPSIYERGELSAIERRQIRAQLSNAVKALETFANPKARLYAERAGFVGRHSGGMPATLGLATAITNDADLAAARVGFTAAFMQELEQVRPDPLDMLYTTMPTRTPNQRINWAGDLPQFEEWTADRKMATSEVFKWDLESKKWSSGLRVKNDDLKYDTLGLLPQQIQGLATKARRHRYDRMMQMLCNGFDGTAFPLTGNGLAYDGSFFFADSHRGGNDNKMTAALDAAGLSAAELLLQSMTTYDGVDPLDTHGTHLIVGPKLQATAEKLLSQERLANGEDNYHRGKYKLILSNRIRGVQDDYWFLADLSHSIKPCIFQLVEEITTSAVIDQGNSNSVPSFINDELWFGAQANYNMSPFEFRLIVGSQVA